jgi:glycosyltransferase involved in cell wall biosynthesis
LRKFWPFITTSTVAILPKKTKLVAISKRAYKAYKPFFGNNLLTYIYHGIDPANIPFNPKPQKNHEVQLCFLGQIAPEKRPHIAIRVADMLYEKKYDVELFIMGKLDYPFTNYAKKIINMVKVRKYIKIFPNIRTEEMYKILGNCDALLAVSTEIGLGFAHLEALATGTPLVGLVNGPAEELIKHGINGYLGTNLEELAKYSTLAMELDRSKCRFVVEEEFSARAMYEKYLNIYNTLLETL